MKLIVFCVNRYASDGEESGQMANIQNIISIGAIGYNVFDSVNPLILPFVIIWSFIHAHKKFGPHRSHVAKRFALASVSKFLQFILTVNFLIALLAIESVFLNKWLRVSGFLNETTESHTINVSNPIIIITFQAAQLLWFVFASNILAISLLPSDLPAEVPTTKMLELEESTTDTLVISPEIWKNIFGMLLYQVGVLFILAWSKTE
jgi:hypothetical protein